MCFVNHILYNECGTAGRYTRDIRLVLYDILLLVLFDKISK